jgi:lipopolysaccharide biosynthesis glycosyltransferase
MNDVLSIYIGYDQREDEAWEVCRKSLERRSTTALHVVKLEERALRYNGWYDRPWRIEGGQKVDDRDGKPFSTDFAFTRFLVPALALHQGWALFCDGDFLFTADIAGLFELADPRYAVQVVKHRHDPVETVKMDGVQQTKYHRKNWSSLILWNCEHPSNKLLTTAAVNHEPGQWLHAFGWLRDEEIGEIPLTWNWLSGVNEASDQLPCGIHYTLGIPTMRGCENFPYAANWMAERDSTRTARRPLPTEQLRALG